MSMSKQHFAGNGRAMWRPISLVEQPLTRRSVLCLGATSVLALSLAGCEAKDWYGIDVAGTLPDLAFTLTRASDRQVVTEADYRGQTVAMFFGYTYCPDICPMTLANLTAVADRLGTSAKKLSILFITVDPERDTLDQLATYVSHFTDRATGLRGTADQLISLTRRLRVTYKISPHSDGATDYAVSHGKSVYVFDSEGKARLIWTAFDGADADIAAANGDIEHLIG